MIGKNDQLPGVTVDVDMTANGDLVRVNEGVKLGVRVNVIVGVKLGVRVGRGVLVGGFVAVDVGGRPLIVKRVLTLKTVPL